MRWLVAALLGLACAACDDSPGACLGSLCGKGQCSPAAICTDACEKKIITAGDVCPAGYGCLGLNVCTGGDGGLPDFAHQPDQSVPLDLSMAQDLTTAQVLTELDGTSDGSTD
jgi:hypothetical protein